MKELIISAYQRDYNDWIKSINDDVKITVYRKGSKLENSNEIFLSNNVGQDVHTFFYHILHNYNNLADYTITSQDYPFDHVKNYIEIINSDENYWEIECKQKIGGYYAFNTRSALNWDTNTPRDSWHDVYPGKTLSCKENGAPHHEPPNYGLNINTLWSELFLQPPPEDFEFVPAGHFIVSRDQIKIRPIEFYEKVVYNLENRQKAPWEIERLEPYIFNPKIK
jgi:hypothetical protein